MTIKYACIQQCDNEASYDASYIGKTADSIIGLLGFWLILADFYNIKKNQLLLSLNHSIVEKSIL